MKRYDEFKIDTKGLTILQFIIGFFAVFITAILIIGIFACSEYINLNILFIILGVYLIFITPYIIVYCILQYSIDMAYNISEQSNIQLNIYNLLNKIESKIQ